MEKARRDNLKAVIGRARSRVEESLRQQLVSYGLFTDTRPLSKAEAGVRPDQEAHYQWVLDTVKHEARAVGTNESVTPEAVARFVRQVGGTWVNRLAALRALEARGLLDPQAALVGDEYGGLSPRAQRLRERAAEEGRPLAPDEALRLGIEDACRELSESVRVLFDLSDEQSLLWPDHVALRDVLRFFSTDVTPDDWAQADVLGWVYQYYNTEANAELKRRKNRTTGFKYRPDDIPIANQFYTPHWVVRVLTDNTLGRLWLETQDRLPQLEPHGETRDGKTSTRYRLIERRQGIPHAANEAEAFRAWIAEEPDVQRDGTVDRLCRFLVPLPSRPLPRAKKPVRDIRVLDPACGSGHFLLYAFDVLFAMYREDEPDLDPRAIPALILERNLFGIDIDLRAAQLAAFDLYLKARSTLAVIDPSAKLDLRGLNIVIADAHIGDDPRKHAFLDRYRSDLDVQQLYRKILTDLDHTNALGSLIKVRTEFETLFGRIRQGRERAHEAGHNWAGPAQGVLIDTSPQLDLRETYRSHSGKAWTIGELLDHLRRFEAEVVPSQDIGARLFYTDVERTVGLLGLLSEQYDVVLMNPPYGDMPPETKDYLKGNKQKKVPAHYPRTHGDLFAAFIEQALDLTLPNGFVGALVPWTYMYLSSLKELRTEIFCGEARPELLQEYGYGILDGATVGTVGTVARKLAPDEAPSVLHHTCVFDRLSEQRKDWQKYDKFLATYPRFTASGPAPEIDWFVARLGSLQDVPGMPYAYWASDSIRALFRTCPPLDRDQQGALVLGRPNSKIADVKQGLATADDSRFTRFWWEVPADQVGHGQRWVPFVKGGTHVRFYTRVDLVVSWDDNGREQREFGKGRYQATDFYFRPGVTWPPASWRIRRFGMFGDGHIFGHKGCSIFPVSADARAIAGLLNSSVGTIAMLTQTPERMWEVGMVAAVPIATITTTAEELAGHTAALLDFAREAHVGDETCRDFIAPDLLRLYRKGRHLSAPVPFDLGGLLDGWRAERRSAIEQEVRCIGHLDEEVYRLYAISAEDRALIERELARRPRSKSGYSAAELGEVLEEESDRDACDSMESEGEADDDAGAEDTGEIPATLSPDVTRDLVARWLSYYLKQTIEPDEDGIVPVGAIHGEPAVIIRLREGIARDLGEPAAQALEQQAPGYLGTKDLAAWLEADFFPWHVALYRNRPIFWLLSSENFEQGKTRLTFRAYLHYLELTPDTLPRLLAYCLDPMLESAEREWNRARDEAGRLEGKAKSVAVRTAEEWLNTVAALKGFRAAVERVIQGPAHAEKVPAKAKWLDRTIAEVRGGQDIGHGYRPDIDHGVRVNIAPIVEQKLLPRVVLKRLGG